MSAMVYETMQPGASANEAVLDPIATKLAARPDILNRRESPIEGFHDVVHGVESAAPPRSMRAAGNIPKH